MLSRGVRFRILQRDDFTCQYCGRRPPVVVLEIDHINPRAKGGVNKASNLTTACFDCNRGKLDSLLSPDQVRHFSKEAPAKPRKPTREPVVKRAVVRRKPAKREPSMRYSLPIYGGGAYRGRQGFDHVPVSLGLHYIRPDTFIGEWRCRECGFYNSYEHDQCSCDREARERSHNGGLTNRELERQHEREECDCYDCDDCTDLRPNCVVCLEEEREEGRPVCRDCWPEYYGEPCPYYEGAL